MQLNQEKNNNRTIQLARLAVAITFFNNGFLYANWVSRLPRIQEIYGFDNGQLGMVLLAVAVGALFAMPFTGWIISKEGTQRIITIGAIFFCLVVPFIPMMPGAVALFGLFFCMGATTGILDVTMNAQAVLVEGAYRRPIMASFHAIFSAGMMVGAGSGALFTALNSPLWLHLVIVSTFCLVLLIWANRHLMPDPEKEPTVGDGPAFRWPTRALVGIGFIAFCCMLGEGAMADWSTNYMRKVAMADKSLAPMGLAAFSLAMMLCRFLGDRLRMALGDTLLLTTTSITAFLGILLVIAVPYPVPVIIGLFIVGMGLSTIVPIVYSQAGAMPGLPSGVGISMVTTIGYSGFLFGPPLIGFLADWQNLRFAMGLVLVLFVVMTLLSLRQGKPKKKQESRKTQPSATKNEKVLETV